jgi:hypothetical protein
MMPIDIRKLGARRRFRLLQSDLPAAANPSRPRNLKAEKLDHRPETAEPAGVSGRDHSTIRPLVAAALHRSDGRSAVQVCQHLDTCEHRNYLDARVGVSRSASGAQ